MTPRQMASGTAPLIAVTQRVITDPRFGERRDALDQRWSGFLQACGFCPVLLPNHPELACTLLQHLPLAGLLLTGGNSLLSCGGDAPERDATEQQLLSAALERMIPVLGVCRGAQLIWQQAGGLLEPVSEHVGRHVLTSGRNVNSYHDFAATGQACGMRVTERCAADQGIEAFCAEDGPQRLAAIFWHPEREDPFDPQDIALFRQHFGEMPL